MAEIFVIRFSKIAQGNPRRHQVSLVVSYSKANVIELIAVAKGVIGLLRAELALAAITNVVARPRRITSCAFPA